MSVVAPSEPKTDRFGAVTYHPNGSKWYSVQELLDRTVTVARENVMEGGRPFSTLIVKTELGGDDGKQEGGRIMAEAGNKVAQTCIPTKHAEVVAIEALCAEQKSESLEGMDIYILTNPCPMCLGAMYYTSPDRVVFQTTRDDYSSFYVDTRKYIDFGSFYGEFGKQLEDRKMPMARLPNAKEDGTGAIDVYKLWQQENPNDTANTKYAPSE